MNKERVVFGTMGGLLTLANAFGCPAEARAQEGICAAVYDTVNPGTSSGRLRKAVGEYAAHNIDVHALILAQAPAGVTDSRGLAAYQEKIANRCNYANKGYVSVAVTDSPRLFNTQKNGGADRAIADSTVEAARPGFVADLKDRSTPYQDDVAGLLEVIDPFKAHGTPTAENRPPQEEPSRTEQAPLNIPWLPIGGGLAIATTVGAAGARIVRQRQISKTYRVQNGKLVEELNNGRVVVDEAERFTSGLPEGGALELREAVKQLKLAEGNTDARRAEIAAEYGKAVKRIWPDRYITDGIAKELSGAMDTVAKLRQAVVAEREEFIQRREKVKTGIEDFNQSVSDCTTLLNTLEFGGWDVTPLEREFTEIKDEAANTIGELRVDENVEKLEVSLGTSMPLLRGMYDRLVKIETDREMTDEKVGNQPNDIASVDDAVRLAKTQFAALETEYDASCYDDLTEQMNGLDDSRKKLDSLYAPAQKTVGQKIYATLQESVRLVKDFDAVIADITLITEKVAQRTEKIAVIKEKLPKLLSTIASTLDNAHEYAFSGEFADDVENDTRQLIENAQNDFESFKKEEVSVAKPKYLELEKTSEAHKQRAGTLLARAHAEKAEMDNLRSLYSKYIKEANETYRSLGTYISNHSSDLSGFGRINVDIPTYRQGRTRKELRAAVDALRQIQASIDQARADAELEVRRAEERREAKRQAAIAAALALEAKRQRDETEARERREEAQRPSNNGGGFGPSNSGGRIGPSNSGGSF